MGHAWPTRFHTWFLLKNGQNGQKKSSKTGLTYGGVMELEFAGEEGDGHVLGKHSHEPVQADVHPKLNQERLKMSSSH
jgi:hypothetical protein